MVLHQCEGDYCRLDENLQPIARITGKSPSYLDRSGHARTLNHKTYQNRQPTEQELREWFVHPDTGIGTLGGHSGVDWLDFDAKNYLSQEECDCSVAELIERHNLSGSWIERTGSGGYRIAVRPQEKPTFTNFAIEPDGVHIGEALFEGRFTVLAPSIHPNGKAYTRIGQGEPISVSKLEAIGIYPTADEKSNAERKQKRSASQNSTDTRPTDPASKPWDIRNFAEHLIGYRIEGDWINCKCPAHNGTSDNSLHIRVDTGAFHCWSGCDTKRIYSEAKANAIASGYEIPPGFTQSKESQNKSDQQERIENRDRWIAKRKFRFGQYWEDLKRDFLLPTVVNGSEIRYTVYKGNVPEFDLYSDTTCLQGWLAAGKTHRMIESLVRFQDKPIVWVSPRNSLLRQTAQRLKKLGFEVFHYQDDPGRFRSMLEAGVPGVYLMAPDSFKTYAVGNVQWDNVILAIDEFSGIRKDILSKTAEHPQYLDAIKRCGSLIAADAFLAQIDIRVIQKHRSGSMQILKQDFQKSPVAIKWLECRNKAGEVSFSHEGIYYNLLDLWIAEGIGRIAIAVDNLAIAKLLDRYLKSKGVKTWIVCSETPQENSSFMPNPDKVIEDGKIQAVIYTPTAQSGLDIQAKFDRGLLIATGTLSPLQMLQMLGRCRRCPEWFVSAPRRSLAPDCVTPSLDGRKIRQWAAQLVQTFNDHEFNAPQSIQGWSLWDKQTSEIEKAFTSEYTWHLLDYHFESVETIEVEGDRVSEWRKDAQILSIEDHERTLKANLKNGLRLKEEQKQPKINSEVWDCKLADFWLKYPKVAEKAIADIGIAERAEDAIDMTKLFLSRRVEKLRNFVIATEPNQQDDRDLLQYLREKATHYSAGNFKRLQMTKLFRVMNLGSLASVASVKELEADTNAFRFDSAEIFKLYRRFCADPNLVRLFPLVDSQKAFFDAIKACLSYLGYERGGKSIRVETEELNSNGTDRNGNQRFSKSKSIYFVYWLLMECSGSAYFRENFELILDSIRDRLSTEREERRKRREEKERYESPPVAA